jgi:hypothetical protein
MRGGNHGKIKIECTVDPLIADALVMLRVVSDDRDVIDSRRLRRYVAEVIETYVPHLFKQKFGISISEFRRRFPAPVAKELPGIARRMSTPTPQRSRPTTEQGVSA